MQAGDRLPISPADFVVSPVGRIESKRVRPRKLKRQRSCHGERFFALRQLLLEAFVQVVVVGMKEMSSIATAFQRNTATFSPNDCMIDASS